MNSILSPLFVLSGPSGSGKSTVLERVLAEPEPPLRLSVSATTREPRAHERDGVQYHFWTVERFEAEISAGGFVEWAKVFGNYYGTLKAEVEPYRKQGIGVFLDIDVQGADQVRAAYPEAVTIFLRTSSLEEYERRLRRRGTDSADAIERRLAGAKRELARADEYQYVVVNDTLPMAVAELRSIVVMHFKRSGHAR
jgi:guanylate kinase